MSVTLHKSGQALMSDLESRLKLEPNPDRASRRHRRSIGQVMFNGLALVTAPGRVMTPRSRSAQLVAAARARLGGRPARVADVGTGSGAIAIAIAIACPSADVWATDINDGAVALARAN